MNKIENLDLKINNYIKIIDKNNKITYAIIDNVVYNTIPNSNSSEVTVTIKYHIDNN